MNSKMKKLKMPIILIVGYILLLVALLLGISTAKYSDEKMAYVTYGAANFNGVILGDCTSGTVSAFGKTLCADECTPGMEYAEDEETSTAKVIPFSIANGTTPENASEAKVSYSIRLRTTKNMPLLFSLVGITAAEDGAGTVKTLYKADDPVLVEDSEETNKWYEWTFCAVEEDDGNDGGDDDADETEEAVFTLNGGSININNYQLIVEWPISNSGSGIPDNSSQYMKEIDLIELRVTVSSTNSLKEEHGEVTVPLEDLYGTGIIILDPSVEPDTDDATYPYHYSYPVDLRSFRAMKTDGMYEVDETSKIYEFNITNGANLGVAQQTRYTDYVLELKVPYTVEGSGSGSHPVAQATKDFKYTLYYYDSKAKEYVAAESQSSFELRLYNEQVNDPDGKYGTYTVISVEDLTDEKLAEWSAEKSPEHLYKVYFFTMTAESPFRLINKAPDNTGTYQDYASSTKFRLVLTTPEEMEDISQETAFENKLEITAKAVLVDPPVIEEPESGNGDLSQSGSGGDGE